VALETVVELAILALLVWPVVRLEPSSHQRPSQRFGIALAPR
jgi:hypothetical protein